MYCPWPFTQFYIGEDGEATTCCPGWASLSIGNVLHTPPMEIWLGERATRFRESITDQSFRYCTNCGNPESLVSAQPPSVPVDVNLVGSLLLSYDPTCNLRCGSCRLEPRRPTELARKIHEIILGSGVLRHTLEVCLSGGGEAFVSPLFWSFLTSKVDCHPKMKLSLKTNGLLLTRERLDAVVASGKRFGGISISVDAACRKTYVLNRGGNWDMLVDNLEATKDYPMEWRQFNFVVQTNNYGELVDYVEMAERFGATSIYLSALGNWGTYSEEEYRERAVHLPSHPHHENLKAVLRNPVFLDPKIITAKLPVWRPGHPFDHRVKEP